MFNTDEVLRMNDFFLVKNENTQYLKLKYRSV